MTSYVFKTAGLFLFHFRYIPSSLAYGDNGRVPGCLVFTMEILKVR